MPAVQRLITVSPSCQPSVIEVCYGDGEVRSIVHSQEVVGVCGDTIGRISESRLPLQCEDKFTVYTHTLNLLMAVFPELPGCDGTRKVKPIGTLLKQETVSNISWAIRKSAPRSRQITTPAPHHSLF